MNNNSFGFSSPQSASNTNTNTSPTIQTTTKTQPTGLISNPFVQYPPPSLFPPTSQIQPQASNFGITSTTSTYPPPSLFNNYNQQQVPTSTTNRTTISNFPPTSSPQQQFTFNSNPQQLTLPTQQQQPIFNLYPQQQSPSLLPAQQKPIFNQQTIPSSSPFQQQSLFNIQQPNNNLFGNPRLTHPIRLLKEKQPGKKVVAVIVTICGGMTYDPLFSQVQQKTLEGTQVLVYSCDSTAIDGIIKAFQGQQVAQDFIGDDYGKIAREIVAHSKEVDPDCVVFNWECCSSYSNQHFPQGKNLITALLKILISKGHMVMFSDFSLKALINSWDVQLLGKNPFKRTGVTSGAATIKFKPSVLKECPSAQLQILGDLVEDGICNIHCAGNTIRYTVDKDCIDNRYVLEILTICVTKQSLPPSCLHEVNGSLGEAGHVLIRYPAGGMILTSMGHWIELMKIDPSEKKLFQVAEREYGVAFAQQMQNQYYQMNPVCQAQFRSNNATTFIQNQAPCQNMNRKFFN